MERHLEQPGPFEATGPEPSAPVQVNLAPDYHPRTTEPSRVIYSLPAATTRSPAPSIDSWSTTSQFNNRPRSSPSTTQAGMHYVDYDQTSSLIGGSLLHKPGGAPRREPTSSWAAEAYRTTYMDNFRWLQKENTGEAPSIAYRSRPEPEAHAPRYGKRRRVFSGADAWAVAQQSARELFPPPAAPVVEYQDSRTKATVERAVQTEISAVSPSVLVASQSDVHHSSVSPQQEKRHFRSGQSYESSNASVRSQAPQSAQPPQQQKRHFGSGESYESNSVAAPVPRSNAQVASSRFATPSKRPASRKQRSSTPLGASRLEDNPILANQRFPPQPLTFSAQSTYEKEFKWLPRRR